MDTYIVWIAASVVLVAGAGYLMLRKMTGPRPATPASLSPGQPFPEFSAEDEDGNTVLSSDLRGAPAVVLFVRMNWCPFCSKQVKDLTGYYKDIVQLGAKLIFITPRPLETTRRVADIFDVKFDFWLDESLAITRQLGLLMVAGVPKDRRKEYGEDTIWPTAVVVDAGGTIRYTSLSRYIFDRPSPQQLLKELRKI